MMTGIFLIGCGLILLGQCYGALFSYSQQKINLEPARDNYVCSNNYCGKYSYSYISSIWSGIFFTNDELKERKLQFLAQRMNYLVKQGVQCVSSGLVGDGDSCCETKINTYTNYTLQNIEGATRYIVHMPPKYQFIPHGSCVSQKKCSGLCVLEPITHTLLIFDPATGLQCDQFVIPGYCSVVLHRNNRAYIACTSLQLDLILGQVQ